MSCKICGRPSAAGAKLCPDCRAARKRAYDATITQPLMALAGAGTVSRTLSRLRRSESPEAKARRAARKARPAAGAEPVTAVPPAAQVAGRSISRQTMWAALLTAAIVVAAVGGWYLPSHNPTSTEHDAPPPQAAPAQGNQNIGAAPAVAPGVTESAAPALPPLPAIVEREMAPHAPAARTATPKRGAAPKAETAPPEPPAEVEAVPAAPAATVAAAPAPPPRIDPWQQMKDAIGRCPSGFLDRVLCEQRVRLQFCDGHWGQVPQCPGGPAVDHN